MDIPLSIQGAATPTYTAVTAILPTFNRAEYIGMSIQSLLAQTAPASRIIVIDDGSTDETASIVTHYGKRIEYHYQPNRGKSAALNHALGLVEDGFIWIFDDDDIAQPDALEKLLSGFESDPSADFVFGLNDNFGTDEDGREFRYRLPIPVLEPDCIFPRLLEGMFLNQGAMLVKRRCYENTGPFNEQLVRSQDYDMALRLTRRHRGKFVQELIYSQRQHRGVRGTSTSSLNAADREKVWLEYDQKILNGLVPSLQDRELVERGHSAHEGSDIAFRAALRRFVVFSRAALSQQAAFQLRRAAALADEFNTQSIDRLDLEALSRAFDASSRSSISVFLSADVQSGLDAFSHRTLKLEIKRALGAGIAQKLPLSIRKKSPRDISAVLNALVAARGASYAAQTFISTMFSVVAAHLKKRAAAMLDSSRQPTRTQVARVS